MIDRVLPLEQTADAMAAMVAGDVMGKIVLIP